MCGKVDGASRQASSKPKRPDGVLPKVKATKANKEKKVVVALEDTSTVLPLPASAPAPVRSGGNASGMALTVRVEINLPAGGDQETYDRIFKSIRENLLNGNVT